MLPLPATSRVLCEFNGARLCLEAGGEITVRCGNSVSKLYGRVMRGSDGLWFAVMGGAGLGRFRSADELAVRIAQQEGHWWAEAQDAALAAE
jgi:hypothetical protein